MNAPLVKSWAPKLRPAPRLPASVWAEQNLILPASTARPGPLRLQRWQARALDLFFADATRTMALMISAQTGKTTLQDAAIAFTMGGSDIGPGLLVMPTDGVARAYVRDRLNPLIAASPVLRAIVGGGQGGAGNSVAHKSFPGGSLNIASSYDAASLASKSVRYVFADELDRFARSAGPEGDPLLLAVRRQFSFEAIAKTFVTSTPTTSKSRIAEMFGRGTQHRWCVPCPECGTIDFFRFEQLKWAEGKPETAYLLCEHCPHKFTEAERRAAIENPASDWFATAEAETPGLVSLHATELISTFSTMERVAAQAEAVGKDSIKRRTFVNTALAETFDDAETYEVNAEELQAHAVDLAPPYDNEITAITVGADVQKDRIEALFLATMSGQFAVLQYLVFHGDTTSSATWAAFDAALGQTFQLRDGRQLRVTATCVDAGFQQDIVADFVKLQRAKSRNCFASKGQGGAGRPAVRRGARMSTGFHLHLIGTHDLKKFILERLKLSDPKLPGYFHIARHLGGEVFEGFASERMESRTNKRGFDVEQFTKIAERNESLDCLVLAFAIARHVLRFAPPVVTKQSPPDFGKLGADMRSTLNPKAR